MPYIKGPSYEDRLREVIAHCVNTLRDRACEIQRYPGEDIVYCCPDSFAVTVAVSSWRAAALMQQVQKLAFPMFSMPPIRLEGDRYVSTFRIA